MLRIWTVFTKELRDILRDTRGLLTVSLLTVLAGPLVLLFIANMLSDFEIKAERRLVTLVGAEHSPSLVNYLQRESAQIVEAPADYRLALEQGRLQEAVVVIPPGFDQDWQAGQAVTLTLLNNSASGQVEVSVNRIRRWLQGYGKLQSEWYFMVQGVAPHMGDQLQIEEIDLANDQAQAVRIFGMLPFFLCFAALYGVWASAIETTIGERERGLHELLLVTPLTVFELVLGKWLAVSVVGLMITLCAVFSFVPAQHWIASDALRAMFQFTVHEAGVTALLLLPLVCVLSALLMGLAAHTTSQRQAQSYATGLMLLLAMLPITTQQLPLHGHSWLQTLPVLAQHRGILSMLADTANPASFPWVAFLVTHVLIAILGLSAVYRAYAKLRHGR